VTVAALRRLIAFYESQGQAAAAADYRSRVPQGTPPKKSRPA